MEQVEVNLPCPIIWCKKYFSSSALCDSHILSSHPSAISCEHPGCEAVLTAKSYEKHKTTQHETVEKQQPMKRRHRKKQRKFVPKSAYAALVEDNSKLKEKLQMEKEKVSKMMKQLQSILDSEFCD